MLNFFPSTPGLINFGKVGGDVLHTKGPMVRLSSKLLRLAEFIPFHQRIRNAHFAKAAISRHET